MFNILKYNAFPLSDGWSGYYVEVYPWTDMDEITTAAEEMLDRQKADNGLLRVYEATDTSFNIMDQTPLGYIEVVRSEVGGNSTYKHFTAGGREVVYKSFDPTKFYLGC